MRKERKGNQSVTSLKGWVKMRDEEEKIGGIGGKEKGSFKAILKGMLLGRWCALVKMNTAARLLQFHACP